MSIPDPVSHSELLDFAETDKTWANLSEDERRSTVADLLSQVANFGVHDVPSGRRDAYGDVIAPGETAAMREALLAKTSTNSSCGLLIRSLWRFLGASDPLLDPPYKPGLVMTNVIKYAAANGAQKALAGFAPQKGDVLFIEKPGHQHIFTVIDASGDDDTITISSIDGGQMNPKTTVDDGSCNCIQPRERKLTKATLQFEDGNKVTHWMDVCQASFTAFTAPIAELIKKMSDDDVV